MKRALVGVLATGTLALGLSAPASAATPNHHASCAGLGAASFAGQPGEWAAFVHRVVGSPVNPPGRTIRNFLAHRHAGSAGVCLD